MTAPYAIGLDVGGTKTLGVVVDESDTVVATLRLPTDSAGADAVAATVRAVITGLLERTGLETTDVATIGIGIPGRVDHERGAVTHALNLGVLDEPFTIAAGVRADFGIDVRVENDVNAAALGAFHLLGDTSVRDVAYLSLGTGIAAGIVLDGEIRRGVHGVAGEIGHFPIDPAGPACDCGLRGCLEASASGSAIARRWPGDGLTAPALHLFSAAAAGNPKAVAIRDSVLDDLARAILMLTLTVDPDRVVLGGGVVEVGPPLLVGVREALNRFARRSPFIASVTIAERTVTVDCEVPVGAIGAALVGRAV